MTQVNDLFEHTLQNLKVSNAEQIKARRDEITKALNLEFRGNDSSSSNRRMVGSWGRHTAIDGVSDLDLIYILPDGMRSDFHKDGGPKKVLQRVKDAIQTHYSTTSVTIDRLVVVVQFSNYKFEVQPCFESDDRSFEYPDTYSNLWKRTDPRSEITAIRELNETTSNYARALCRLVRAWKRKHDVSMNGLLIDTLVWRFFNQTDDYPDPTLLHDQMVLEFFTFLSELPKQEYWSALGSGQRVKVKTNFQRKAKKAMALCQDAIATAGKDSIYTKWRKIFGRFVPADSKSTSADVQERYVDSEEFVEDLYEVDIKYDLNIDCKVTQDGFRPMQLREMLKRKAFLRPRKDLTFTVTSTNVPEPYELRWKVLNRGDEAEKRDEIRGQIIKGSGARSHLETTKFRGNHYVECFALRDGVVVARSHLDVPIRPDPAS